MSVGGSTSVFLMDSFLMAWLDSPFGWVFRLHSVFPTTIPRPCSLWLACKVAPSPFPWLPNAAAHQSSTVSGFPGSMLGDPKQRSWWHLWPAPRSRVGLQQCMTSPMACRAPPPLTSRGHCPGWNSTVCTRSTGLTMQHHLGADSPGACGLGKAPLPGTGSVLQPCGPWKPEIIGVWQRGEGAGPHAHMA